MKKFKLVHSIIIHQDLALCLAYFKLNITLIIKIKRIHSKQDKKETLFLKFIHWQHKILHNKIYSEIGRRVRR